MNEKVSMARRVARRAEARLNWLLSQTSEGVSKATLAQLRRGVGHPPGEIPELWGILLRDLPEDMQGRGTQVSRQELALYTALTLFAVHQQGWDPRTQPMHRPEVPLGGAVARLIPPGDEDAQERMERRFTRAATSTDLAEFAQHLRGLVQLLSAAGQPLDWARLAGQLYDYQNPDRVAAVRLRWGEDFYAALRRGAESNEEEEKNG